MTTILHKTFTIGFIGLLTSTASTQTSLDHLTPIPPNLFQEAPDPIFTYLLNQESVRLWMVAAPSFAPEHTISINEQLTFEESENDDIHIKSRTYKLEFAAFKTKIFLPKNFRNGKPVFNINPETDIDRWSITVEAEFIEAIEAAWIKGLKKTRYPDNRTWMLDGTSYAFYCDQYYGRTTSQSSGIPSQMIQLGEKLRDLAKSSDSERVALKAHCLDLAATITNTSSAHTQKISKGKE